MNNGEKNKENTGEMDEMTQKAIEFFQNEEEIRNFNSKMTKPCMFLGLFFWIDVIVSANSSNHINISLIIAAVCIVYIVVLMFKN